MNKTPIQELIDLLWEELEVSIPEEAIEEFEQKEKEFAFDCFEAGYKARHYFSAGDGDNAFEIFYSQCAEQHTK